MDNRPAEFEGKLARLEEIVQKLESPNVGLDLSVTLFREGKAITAECEAMLKTAEEAVVRLGLSQGDARP